MVQQKILNFVLLIIVILTAFNIINCASPQFRYYDFMNRKEIHNKIKKGDKVILEMKSGKTYEAAFFDMDSTYIYLNFSESIKKLDKITKFNIHKIKSLKRQPKNKLPIIIRFGIGVSFIFVFLLLFAWGEIGPLIGGAV